MQCSEMDDWREPNPANRPKPLILASQSAPDREATLPQLSPRFLVDLARPDEIRKPPKPTYRAAFATPLLPILVVVRLTNGDGADAAPKRISSR